MKLKRAYNLIIFVAFLLVLSYVQVIMTVPNELIVIEGQKYNCNFGILATVDNDTKLKINSDHKSILSSAFSIECEELGNYIVNVKYFGLIPVKKVNINIVPNINVIPCGNSIGVKMTTNGVVVVGMSEFDGMDNKKYRPYQASGIRYGDILIEANSEKIRSTRHLIEIVNNCKDKPIEFTVKREAIYFKTSIMPIKNINSNSYKLGLWIRDSTAGIGTLTFYDNKSNIYGALGHGITDVDTGILMPVGNGEVLRSSIISVRKGKRGNPGELKGVLIDGDEITGNIVVNSKYGIYGKMFLKPDNLVYKKPIPISLRNDIKEGKAQILSNVYSTEIEKYNIQIEKIYRQNVNTSKNMVIKITDVELLQKTGGIVQGMSGSPIIQNGKLIGAVTHVLVNDPTKGYGVFIETMLKQMNNI